ncbi:MAG TPA: DUF4097 family beta strand repeat-containing protein [Bryobacteraceae bacterium]|jgi:DUF4097 and DUF4098 domain-containing protein YvlB|nr:DUF4097 family beta strand repeat-containing protein [Bryobacteraceae bacterium]
MRFHFAPALLSLCTVFLTGCIDVDFSPSDRYQADFHYSYDLDPGGRINLENANGSVEISGWDENKVEITGVKFASTKEGLEEIRVDVHHSPGSVDIRTTRPSSHFGSMGARYAIKVPKTAVLDRVVTSNARIRIQDLDTSASLKTSNGPIRVENLRGAVDAQTSNGSVELHSIGGDARIRTSNGPVRAEGIAGEFTAHTSNGGITISMDRAPKNGIRAETTNGGITVHLPGGSAARLEADTSNGSVRTDFDLSGSVRESRNHLNGRIGEGGPLIELTTRNGSIGVLRM